MTKQISELTDQEFAELFQQLHKRILLDPYNDFVRAPGFINFSPTPGQAVVLKNVFGQALDSTTKHAVLTEIPSEDKTFDLQYRDFTEIELFQALTGFPYVYTGKKFNRVNLLCGRRSGKSTISSIIALYSAIKLNWKVFLRKTPVATVAILSHSVEFSQEILDILRVMVEESPILLRMKDGTKKDTQSTFHLKVPFIVDSKIQYSYVAIKVGAASKKTTRGRAVCTLLTDEICWWNTSSEAKESDTDILRAVRPALMQFGQEGTIIKLSSPALKMGVLYEEWERREELKDDFIQLKAPSWMMNNILPKEEFEKEFRLDPDGFQTEYKANFVDSLSNFISPEFIDLCTIKGVQFLPPSEDKRTIYSAAIDAAFKGDRFAFCVVGYNENRVTQYVLKYWDGNRKDPVKAFTVAEYIKTVCIQYGINSVAADQYAFQPLREIFEQFGVRLVENVFSLPYKRKIYFGLKRLIHSNQMDLLDIPLLHKEIKELQVEQLPSGQIRIGHPNIAGAHDDLSDATAIASYIALENAGAGSIAPDIAPIASTYGIQTDIQGRSFVAPSAEMLYQGVVDISDNYVKHPETGKYIRKEELENELAPGSGGNFIF